MSDSLYPSSNVGLRGSAGSCGTHGENIVGNAHSHSKQLNEKVNIICGMSGQEGEGGGGGDPWRRVERESKEGGGGGYRCDVQSSNLSLNSSKLPSNSTEVRTWFHNEVFNEVIMRLEVRGQGSGLLTSQPLHLDRVPHPSTLRPSHSPLNPHFNPQSLTFNAQP